MCLATPIAFSWITSAIASLLSSHTPLVAIRPMMSTCASEVGTIEESLENCEICLSSPMMPCFNFMSVDGERKRSEESIVARECGGDNNEAAMGAECDLP